MKEIDSLNVKEQRITFYRDPRFYFARDTTVRLSRKEIPTPAFLEEIIVAESFRDVKGKTLTQIPNFEHKLGNPIVKAQKRAQFSGHIVHLAEPLDFELPVSASKEEMILLFNKIQPCHMGEAEDDRGFEYQKTNFLVDSKNTGWHMPRDLTFQVVRRFFPKYKQGSQNVLDIVLLRVMSNRMWKVDASETDPRTETIVPDAYYYQHTKIKTGDLVSTHVWNVCDKLGFVCHPHMRAEAAKQRKKKSDQKARKKQNIPGSFSSVAGLGTSITILQTKIAKAKTKVVAAKKRSRDEEEAEVTERKEGCPFSEIHVPLVKKLKAQALILNNLADEKKHIMECKTLLASNNAKMNEFAKLYNIMCCEECNAC